MGDLFGTDGIRGLANQYPLDCETALTMGRAVAAHFQEKGRHRSGQFVVGQDTRISGDMLVGAVTAGLCSMGATVSPVGVCPTPGVAYLTASQACDAGIMVSASHNPYQDNGIKLFNGEGFKLSDEDERAVETRIQDPLSLRKACAKINRVGICLPLDSPRRNYLAFLKQCLRGSTSFTGLNLVIDCANGAASRIAPRLFRELGASVKAIFCDPDGVNINAHCGSQHPETLSETVVAEQADLGLAFDGDADRLIAVDEKGVPLSGDQVMAIVAHHMKSKGQLTNPVVVTTVMSNLGLGAALTKMGIRHLKTDVGDRQVMQQMLAENAGFGGEDSGHMIFLGQHTTGDGLLAGIKLLEAVCAAKQPLSTLSSIMTVYPQCLINVDVHAKPDLESVKEVKTAIEEAETRLGKKGRVLVRYSGTQPQCRVMVEGPTKEKTDRWCRFIADTVERCLG